MAGPDGINATLLGGTYNSGGITLTTGQQSPLQVDENGNLLTSAQSSPSEGPVAPGTAASKSNLGGAVYTAAGITLANAQQAALQVDVSGHLLVNVQSTPAEGAVAP